MLSRLRHASHQWLARLPALLPSSCSLCGATAPEALCAGCATRYFRRRGQRCVQCAIVLPQGAHDRCGNCLRHTPAFDATVAAADYAAPIDQLVLALKFGSRLELAPLLARMLRDAALEARAIHETRSGLDTQQPGLPTLLTAVPLGRQRLIERGFNQALEIAKPLSRALGVPLAPRLLARQRETQAQSLLHPDERHRNIRQAFCVPADAIDTVRGQHIGVVDDVMTTGETLNEIAVTLKRFGAARVTGFVFARTLPA